MYTSILVPLDGSVFAEWALPTAIGIARATGATLHLLNVEVPTPTAVFGLSTTETSWLESVTERRIDYLNETADRIEQSTGLSVKTEIRRGLAPELISLAAAELAAGLIVMTTHGRGPFRRFWLGSVATEVIRRAERPLLLLRPERRGRPQLTAAPLFRHVLVPLDYSAYSEEVLGDAVALGQLFDADYTLMHVIEPTLLTTALPLGPVVPTVDPELIRETRNAADAHLRNVADRLRKRELEVETVVAVEPHAAGAILEFANQKSIDLIALTTHGRGGFGRLILGSVADKVIRGARMPVLVYRPRGK